MSDRPEQLATVQKECYEIFCKKNAEQIPTIPAPTTAICGVDFINLS